MLLTLIGPPASGKGTLAKRLAEMLGCRTISTGDLLRKKAETDETLAALLSTGGLLPERLYRQEVLQNIYGRSKDGLILDGFPRTAEQATFLGLHVKEQSSPLGWYAIILEASPDTIRTRLASRQQEQTRDDDAKLTERLTIYENELTDLKTTLRLMQVPGIIVDTDTRDATGVYTEAFRGIFHNRNDLTTR